MVAAGILPGIDFDNWKYLLTASLLLGILNALLRPRLLRISLPRGILSRGLYVIVINALLLSLVGQLVTGFHVNSFWDAFLGAILISITTLALNTLTGKNEARLQPRQRPNPRHRQKPPPPGKGPVIDV